ncbi:hypothetical protein CFC21_085336 [Triticum aestivum]|uniref:Uncharacterized protein n=2 Tax=Triticum aestivum TaxID=4565 RepID=A0A3B6NXQ0_WHEAT|nr:uncharacterized protein LOC123128996 [Triticum aestivum]KAF7081392.1 hypothetical protein CFC21_085336 [Triticum aestivum]
MEAAAPSAALRVYGPSNFRDDELVFNSGEIGRLESELRAKIESCYGRVRQLPGVLDAGFCFGLLDPVSNIVAGASIARAAVEAKEEEEEEERSLPGARLGEPDLIGDMNRRSFHGLVDFLTALFPHLTNAMARLDPLVAALLIVKRRGMERSFGFASDTTAAAVETALRCAAASAQHPNPSQFALGWKLLSHSELNNVAAVLPSSANSDYSDESFAAAIAMVDDVLLKKQPQPTSVLSLEKSWELASARLRNLGPDLSPIVLEKKVFLERAAVWRMLLTTIHGYYLQALARLPKDKLQSHYHHSLLQAGHCYGPLDPVGNIILNTIWYSRAYPPAKNVEISAISTRGLLRIAVRSLYGLVSFLCTRCAATHLTPDEAIRRLQAVAADLRLADPNLLLDDDKNDDDMVVSATVEQAYTAAAAAARHPEPHHQVELLRPCNSVLRMASDRLKGDAMLPHEDAEHLSESMRMLSMLLSEHQQQPETKIKVLDRWAHIRVQHRINKFWDQHARLVGMAKSAMDSYSNELGVPSYKLHVICGANEYVDGPVCTRPGKGYYRCSHINFLAAQSAATPPTLFFAECANDGTEVRLCCPVRVLPPGTEQVRCMYCEYHGCRIVHPTRESFRGRDIEFEKMLCGVYSQSFTNNGIIAHSREVSGCVGAVVDDCIYDVYRLDDTPIKAEDFVRMSDANVVFD